MDYMIALQKKRGREYLEDRESCHQAKRLCNGPGSCGQIICGSLVESPMDTWESQKQGPQNGNAVLNHHDPNMVYTTQAGASPQICPRCMAGESGHINHIMGC